jgi:hypothetical protein
VPDWCKTVQHLFGRAGSARKLIKHERLRSVECRNLYADAAYVTHRVAFPQDRQQVFVERCGLVLTRRPPADEQEYRQRIGRWLKRYGKIPAGYGDKAIRVAVLGKPTRAALLQGVRHGLSYPRSMMYHDADQVTAALNGLLAARVYLTARFGPKSQEAFFERVGADLGYR